MPNVATRFQPDISGSAVPSGFVGEILKNNRATNTPNVTSNQWTSIDSGNITYNDGNEVGVICNPGIWLLQGTGYFLPQTSCVMTFAQVSIGTAKGNNGTGVLGLENSMFLNLTFATGASDSCLVTPCWYVNISSTTTYYLKAYATFSSGNLVLRGELKAIRLI